MAGVPANRGPTNMVFQSYAIFPHLNVRENIGYGLRNEALARPEARARQAALASGQARQLWRARGASAIRRPAPARGPRARPRLRPKVLLLDEPLGALDKKLREEMQIELRQLQRTVGITFVFVTHDQEEALTLSDRIAVMSRGKVLQIDSVERLYEAPNCREVAEFIGSMNFIEGRVAGEEGDGLVIDVGASGTLRVQKGSAKSGARNARLSRDPPRKARARISSPIRKTSIGSKARSSRRPTSAIEVTSSSGFQAATDPLRSRCRTAVARCSPFMPSRAESGFPGRSKQVFS